MHQAQSWHPKIIPVPNILTLQMVSAHPSQVLSIREAKLPWHMSLKEHAVTDMSSIIELLTVQQRLTEMPYHFQGTANDAAEGRCSI